VETYVANGSGIGLGLYIPKAKFSPKIRLVPLPDFPPLVVGAMWKGMRTPILDCLLEECHRRVRYVSS
jgi:hypothetical protein